MNCPTCGHKVTNGDNGRGKDASAKLLAQDRGRAEMAIGVLSRRMDMNSEPLHIQEAMLSERLRLQVAIERPSLLWAIYRRAEKRKSVDYREHAQEQGVAV